MGRSWIYGNVGQQHAYHYHQKQLPSSRLPAFQSINIGAGDLVVVLIPGYSLNVPVAANTGSTMGTFTNVYFAANSAQLFWKFSATQNRRNHHIVLRNRAGMCFRSVGLILLHTPFDNVPSNNTAAVRSQHAFHYHYQSAI